MNQEERIIQIDDCNNYSTTYKITKDEGIKCYAKKQLDAIYPNGGFKVIGEFAPKCAGGKERFEYDGKILPMHAPGSLKGAKYVHAGYLAVAGQSDCFVALLKRKSAALPIAVAAVLAVGIGVFAVLSTMPKTAADAPSPTANIDQSAVDWQGNLNDSSGGTAQGIRIPGFKTMTLKAGETAQQTDRFKNPADNNCYFVLRLVLLDEKGYVKDTLYESDMIEPGKGVYDFKLSHELAAGKYDAQIQYDTYSMQSLTGLNGAVLNLELIVE